MRFHTFSTSTLLGTDIFTASGVVIGQLEDVICDQTSGQITYFLLSCCRYEDKLKENLYAIHYSYFYLDGDDETMVFNAERGSKRHLTLPRLPNNYERSLVLSYQEFKVNILPNLSVANHRSDNE